MRRIMYLWLPRWPIDRLRLSQRRNFDAPAEETPFATVIGAACAMARFAEAGGNAVILPSGEVRAALASLPVEALRLDPTTAQGLRRVGLKRIGDLYAMPRDALTRRFGETVAQRLDQALD